jgi:threonine/homoserine/homoserine lactone efflux protein
MKRRDEDAGSEAGSAMSGLSGATIINGLILGWSVAWPPGPINAEMIRRALIPRTQGGGFWAAWQLGLGACTGDFVWAFGVAAGAGALLASPRLHLALGVISFFLLLFLAFNFARGAWRTAHTYRQPTTAGSALRRPVRSQGYFLGLILALTSPWSLGFWFAVVGGPFHLFALRTFFSCQAGKILGSLSENRGLKPGKKSLLPQLFISFRPTFAV